MDRDQQRRRVAGLGQLEVGQLEAGPEFAQHYRASSHLLGELVKSSGTDTMGWVPMLSGTAAGSSRPRGRCPGGFPPAMT
jgi:hypothetical protein